MPIARRRLAALALLPLAWPATARAATKREIDDAVAPPWRGCATRTAPASWPTTPRPSWSSPHRPPSGFVFGGQYGNGVDDQGHRDHRLLQHRRRQLLGLQIGAQSYGLAMFIMTAERRSTSSAKSQGSGNWHRPQRGGAGCGPCRQPDLHHHEPGRLCRDLRPAGLDGGADARTGRRSAGSRRSSLRWSQGGLAEGVIASCGVCDRPGRLAGA